MTTVSRQWIKVSLPPELGIVYEDDDTEEADDCQGDSVNLDATLAKDDVQDMVDLHDLGGTVSWPDGWDIRRARAFIS